MARLLSVNAGLPKDIRWNGWTAVWKDPVTGKRTVGQIRTEIFGPAQSITPGVIDQGTRHPHPP